MSEDEAKSPRLFDVRTIDRNIRKGLTTRKDYDKYLKSLPDVAEKAAPSDARSLDIDEDALDDMEDDIDEDDDAAPAVAGVAAVAAEGGQKNEDDDDEDDDDMADDIDEDNDVVGNGTPANGKPRNDTSV